MKKAPVCETVPPATDSDIPEKKGRPLLAEVIISLLLLAGICMLPTLHLYASNIGMIKFPTLLPTFFLYFGIGAVLFCILRLCVKRPYFAGLLTNTAMLFTVNFSWLRWPFGLLKFSSGTRTILAVVLLVLIITGAVFLMRRLTASPATARGIALIFCIVFVGLNLFNLSTVLFAKNQPAVAAAPSAAAAEAEPTPATAEADEPEPDASEAPVTSDAAAVSAPSPTPFEVGTPNLYLIILDEYASFPGIEKYYGYSNEPLRTFLEAASFNVSDTSYTLNDATTSCITNLLCLDFVSTVTNTAIDKVRRSKAITFSTLEDMGYDLYQISTSDGMFTGIPSLHSKDTRTSYKSTTAAGVESDEVVMNNSLLGALETLFGSYAPVDDLGTESASLQQYGYYSTEEIVNSDAFRKNYYGAVAKIAQSCFDFYETDENFGASEPRAVFSYIKCPHVPFLYDEFGRILARSQASNWEDPEVYLGQYKYVSKHLVTMVSTIIRNDPNSIIILQSDHGVRPHGQPFSITKKDAVHVFNAVYFCGQELDIEGLSPTNTLRLILTELGQDFPPVTDPVTADSPDDLK